MVLWSFNTCSAEIPQEVPYRPSRDLLLNRIDEGEEKACRAKFRKGWRKEVPKKGHAAPSWSSSLHSDGGKLLPCAAPLPSPWSSLSHTIDIFKKATWYNEDAHKAALDVWLPVVIFGNWIYGKRWKRDAFVTWLARRVPTTPPPLCPPTVTSILAGWHLVATRAHCSVARERHGNDLLWAGAR